jgi:hypothetical protein
MSLNVETDLQDSSIDSLIQQQAQKLGASAKQTKQALKKLRKGGLMAQIAPQLQESLSNINPNMSLKDKLKAKLDKSKQSRSSSYAKQAQYEKQRAEVHQKEANEVAQKEKAKLDAKKKLKSRALKLKELAKKYGTIQQSHYNECLARQNLNQYSDESARNHDKNIIELYCKQNQFQEKLSMDSDSDDED